MTNGQPVCLVADRQDHHWRLSLDIPGGLLSPGDLPSVQLPEVMNPDIGVVITGRGPVWLYAYLVEQLSDYPWIATFDAGQNRPVVVKSTLADGPAVGDLLAEESTGRPCGVALAVVGYAHRGKSVLVAGFQELLGAYRDDQWHVLRPHADGEGQWAHDADEETVQRLRLHRPWTNDVVARMVANIEALRTNRTLVVVDTGGKNDEITASLLRQCTHALILVTDSKEGAAETATWNAFCKKVEIPVLGTLRTRRDDVPTEVATGGAVCGVVGNLTRTSTRSVKATRPVFEACLQALLLALDLRQA